MTESWAIPEEQCRLSKLQTALCSCADGSAAVSNGPAFPTEPSTCFFLTTKLNHGETPRMALPKATAQGPDQLCWVNYFARPNNINSSGPSLKFCKDSQTPPRALQGKWRQRRIVFCQGMKQKMYTTQCSPFSVLHVWRVSFNRCKRNVYTENWDKRKRWSRTNKSPRIRTQRSQKRSPEHF